MKCVPVNAQWSSVNRLTNVAQASKLSGCHWALRPEGGGEMALSQSLVPAVHLFCSCWLRSAPFRTRCSPREAMESAWLTPSLVFCLLHFGPQGPWALRRSCEDAHTGRVLLGPQWAPLLLLRSHGSSSVSPVPSTGAELIKHSFPYSKERERPPGEQLEFPLHLLTSLSTVL